MIKYMMKTNKRRSFLLTIPVIILILTIIITGCSPTREEMTPTIEIIEELIPTAKPIPTVQPGDHYIPTALYPDTNLLVFSDPSRKSPVVGEIPPGVSGITISESVLEGKTVWAQIDYKQLTGWVDFQNLALTEGDLPNELINLGYQTLIALKTNNLEEIRALIHPALCLRLSPYPYLAESNLSICPDELDRIMSSERVYTWGNYDGTGDPIQMTFTEYYQDFIYDSDYFQAPMVGLNVEISTGNSINNIPEVFPDGRMIEYYFPGFDPMFGGMDWRSLRLVFVKVGEIWYLGAIIHGEWTI